jgi:hypothetical protein
VFAVVVELDTPDGRKKFLVFLVLELGDMIGLHTVARVRDKNFSRLAAPCVTCPITGQQFSELLGLPAERRTGAESDRIIAEAANDLATSRRATVAMESLRKHSLYLVKVSFRFASMLLS